MPMRASVYGSWGSAHVAGNCRSIAAALLPISLMNSMNVLAKCSRGGHGCMAESSTVWPQRSAGHENFGSISSYIVADYMPLISSS